MAFCIPFTSVPYLLFRIKKEGKIWKDDYFTPKNPDLTHSKVKWVMQNPNSAY